MRAQTLHETGTNVKHRTQPIARLEIVTRAQTSHERGDANPTKIKLISKQELSFNNMRDLKLHRGVK
jgi:hypothetical protein